MWEKNCFLWEFFSNIRWVVILHKSVRLLHAVMSDKKYEKIIASHVSYSSNIFAQFCYSRFSLCFLCLILLPGQHIFWPRQKILSPAKKIFRIVLEISGGKWIVQILLPTLFHSNLPIFSWSVRKNNFSWHFSWDVLELHLHLPLFIS